MSCFAELAPAQAAKRQSPSDRRPSSCEGPSDLTDAVRLEEHGNTAKTREGESGEAKRRCSPGTRSAGLLALPASAVFGVATMSEARLSPNIQTASRRRSTIQCLSLRRCSAQICEWPHESVLASTIPDRWKHDDMDCDLGVRDAPAVRDGRPQSPWTDLPQPPFTLHFRPAPQ